MSSHIVTSGPPLSYGVCQTPEDETTGCPGEPQRRGDGKDLLSQGIMETLTLSGQPPLHFWVQKETSPLVGLAGLSVSLAPNVIPADLQCAHSPFQATEPHKARVLSKTHTQEKPK